MGRPLLLTTLGLVIFLGIIQQSFLGRNALKTTRLINSAVASQSTYDAHTALDITLEKLRTDPEWKNQGNPWEISLPRGEATVTIEDHQDDASLAESPRQVRITSTSNMADKTHMIIAVAELNTETLSQINSTLGIMADTDDFELKVEGSSFNINGHDTNLDGSPGPQEPLPGIFAGSSKTYDTLFNTSESYITPSQRNNIDGSGGSPSVQTDPDFPAPDYSQLISDLKLNADRSLHEAQFDSATWGTPDDPQITVVNKSLQILNGDLNGYGVLILEGDDIQLQVDQNLNWQGMIILNGSQSQLQVKKGDLNMDGLLYVAEDKFSDNPQNVYSQLQVSEGSANINGSLLLNQLGPAFNPYIQMQVKQDLNVNYSSEALALAEQIISPFSSENSYYLQNVYE